MPTYEYQCEPCDRRFEIIVPVAHRDHVICNHCGTFAERIWTGAPQMHDDSIPGGMVIENLSAQPQTFYSKSEFRRAQQAAGVMQFVRHQPPPDSDKSKFTSRWI